MEKEIMWILSLLDDSEKKIILNILKGFICQKMVKGE